MAQAQQKLLNKDFEAPGRSVTLREMADHLGVHVTTVSMALRRDKRISDTTRKRVTDLARKLNYTPNHLARSLRKCRTNTIGVVFPYSTLPHYATMLDALYTVASDHGLNLIIQFHDWHSEREREAVRTVAAYRVEGLIFVSCEPDNAQGLAESLAPLRHVPTVMLASSVPTTLPDALVAAVGPDLTLGGHLLAQHLVEVGHRRITWLTLDSQDRALVDPKYTGMNSVIQTVADARLTIAAAPQGARSSADAQGSSRELVNAQAAVERCLAMSPQPTAFVTSNEPSAGLLVRALSEMGRRIPRDVSVVTFDGTYLSRMGAVPLTCAATPYTRIAERAIGHLRSFKPATSSRTVVELLEPALVHGNSVAAPRLTRQAHAVNKD